MPSEEASEVGVMIVEEAEFIVEDELVFGTGGRGVLTILDLVMAMEFFMVANRSTR